MTSRQAAACWYPEPRSTPETRDRNETGRAAEGITPRPSSNNGSPCVAGNSGPNHAVHLILVICTCGWWLPVWLTVTLLDRRTARIGPEPGIRGFLSTHPVVTGIGMLVGLLLIVTDWKAFVLRASLAAVVTGLSMLAVLAIRSVQRRRRETAEIAARADDQHDAVLRGDDRWGVFGIKPPAAVVEPQPAKTGRKSLVGCVAVIAGILVFGVMTTVSARSADRASSPVLAPTVTVTRSANRPAPQPVISLPPLAIPFPLVPSPIPTPTSASTQPPAVPVRVGQPAIDGDLTFVVMSVDRPKTLANPTVPFIQTTAKGTFLTAHLTITNGGKQSEVFVASGQRLRINGAVYTADPAAALWTLMFEAIVSPGATVAVGLSFDVPADTPPGGMLELHESSSSRGATVELLPPQ